MKSQSQRGQTLEAVLVSLAITSIVILAMATMFNNLSRESRAVSEKLASVDLEKTLLTSMADGTVCNYLLTPPGSGGAAATFDPGQITATKPAVVSTAAGFTQIPGSIDATQTPPVAGPALVKAGELASAYSQSLYIKSIGLNVTGCSGTTGTITCQAEWVFSFDPNKVVRGIHPASVSATLVANVTSPSSATVTQCLGVNGAAGGALPSGALCGSVFWETDQFGGSPCGNVQSSTCGGTLLMTQATCGTVKCPTGYSPLSVAYSWGMNGPTRYEYHTWSCAKK